MSAADTPTDAPLPGPEGRPQRARGAWSPQ